MSDLPYETRSYETPSYDTLPFETAGRAAEAVRRKEISPRELVEAVLARIDSVNPAVNAVVGLRREQASDVGSGPLSGVPITVKESFHLREAPVTWGNPAFQGYVSDWDATAVARLKAAGAIVVGQSNAHFMLSDFGRTANEVYGVTNNPWDVERVPGGSSGGSAAAVAAGMSYLDYGTDLVGSIRIPAAFCGVYGLRPTPGTVPVTGMQPPGPPAPPNDLSYISAIGPIARSAGDLRLALRATGGPEGALGKAYEWRLAPPRHRRLAEYRVGVVLDHPAAPVNADVGAVLSAAVDSLARAGVKLVEGWPDGVDPADEAFGFHVGLFLAYQGQGAVDLDRYIEQEQRRTAVRAAWERYFREVDVFLSPVNFTAAFRHDDPPREYERQGFWVAYAGLAGLPALSAPVGRNASGLPVGLQVVGPEHEDDTVITFAELIGGEG
ncbi:MAG TPA: amidase family protein [Candidatus Limnocylindrales bacterium]|nr:amidase family protein [Candidatus Limnocylindrales bacterium]